MRTIAPWRAVVVAVRRPPRWRRGCRRRRRRRRRAAARRPSPTATSSRASGGSARRGRRRRRSRRRAGRRRRAGAGRGGRSTSCSPTAPARRARPTPTGRHPRCRAPRHSGYSDCSQPNSGLSVIGGYARVRFWNRWWWVLTSPGVTRQSVASITVAAAGGGPVPTARRPGRPVMATQPPVELARGRRPSWRRAGVARPQVGVGIAELIGQRLRRWLARSSTVVSGLTMHQRSTVSPSHAVGVTKEWPRASSPSLHAWYCGGAPADAGGTARPTAPARRPARGAARRATSSAPARATASVVSMAAA